MSKCNTGFSLWRQLSSQCNRQRKPDWPLHTPTAEICTEDYLVCPDIQALSRALEGKLSFLKNISEYSRVLPLTLVKNRARKPSVPANCQGFQSNTFCRLFCLANHSTNKQGNENDGYKQTGKNPVAVQLSTPAFLKFRITTKQGQILSTSEGGQSKQTFTTMSLTLPCSCSAAVCRKGQLILISN